MNPLEQLGSLVSKPTEMASRMLTRPSNIGRHRPLYGLNVVDMIKGGNLEDSVAGKVTMITGASSGIGAVVAEKIGAARGEVVLVARGKEKLAETAEAVEAAGGRAHIYPCDLSDLDAIGEMTQQLLADLGGIDILINKRRPFHPSLIGALLRPDARLPADDAAQLLRTRGTYARPATRYA